MQHRMIRSMNAGVQPAPATALCEHLRAIAKVKEAERYECLDCVESGSSWVHLRTCQTCGTTRCCDSSLHRHAHRHAREHRHPVVASAEPGERWLYCYLCHIMTGY